MWYSWKKWIFFYLKKTLNHLFKVNKKTYGNSCNKIEKCNDKLGLSCSKGICQCELNNYWDEVCSKKFN